MLIKSADINKDVTADIIEEFVPEIDVNEVPTPSKAETVTLSAGEDFEENPLVEEVKLTYANEGVDEIVLEKVEVTLSDDYNDPSADNLKAVIEALADKLGLDVDEKLDLTPGAAVLAAAPRAARPVITKAEYDKETKVLTLTLGTEVPPVLVETPVNASDVHNLVAAPVSESAKAEDYAIGAVYKVTGDVEEYYKVELTATSLSEHPRGAGYPTEGAGEMGYWCGIKFDTPAKTVQYSWAYGKTSLQELIDAVRADDKHDADLEGEDAFFAWYPNAGKVQENESEYWAGVTFFDEDGEAFETLYFLIDVSGIQLAE